eukprot:CAMPEP_0174924520 /NCGR_PEP_ID=MMETSP1355-20121228/7299_1 /TAXON_ID=464990 /ORGANISM="Hemiselmis tepida, Strain CCMP443" /LENGTH=49 /DNA_ID=CAMNT_0016170337 /DNA_START=48 /DNA_END=197 /DNA_ORIENTATION=+
MFELLLLWQGDAKVMASQDAMYVRPHKKVHHERHGIYEKEASGILGLKA